MKPNQTGTKRNTHNTIQSITLQYTIQYKNTIIQIEINEMKLNVSKSNRNQTKPNEINYIIQYITLQHTKQYNKHYNSNRENLNEIERNKTKEKPNETKLIQTKSNQYYNTINNNIILNFTRIRNLRTVKTLMVHISPRNT